MTRQMSKIFEMKLICWCSPMSVFSTTLLHSLLEQLTFSAGLRLVQFTRL